MNQAIAFVKQLMEAFFAGMGIALVVNLVIFPSSSRSGVFLQFQAYNEGLRGLVRKQRDYLQSMEPDFDQGSPNIEAQRDVHEAKVKQAATSLTAAVTGITALHGKLHSELVFAKREVAYGKLDAKDIDKMFNCFRQVFLPLLGLGSVVDIFERLIERHNENHEIRTESLGDNTQGFTRPARTTTGMSGWSDVMETLHDPFSFLCDAIIDGLTHASYALELSKRPRTNSSKMGDEDLEKSTVPEPGDGEYGAHLESKIAQFSQTRKLALQTWCTQKGLEVPLGDIHGSSPQLFDQFKTITSNERNRQQLYLILYVSHKFPYRLNLS